MGAIDTTRMQAEEQMLRCCNKVFKCNYTELATLHATELSHLFEYRRAIAERYFSDWIDPDQKKALFEMFLRSNEILKQYLLL